MLSSARRLATTGRSTQARFSTVAAPPRRLVVSRRAWRAYEETLPKQAKKKVEKPEDKPWPRNMLLAGYAVASIFIPYATVWLITASPSLRESFQGVLPLDRLRKHFGEEEWDAQSYVEREERSEGHYQFPSEAPFLERQQQSRIETFNDGKVTANLYILGDDESQAQVKEVPASTRGNREALFELLGTTEAKNVAVDFVDSSDSDESSSTVFGNTLSYPEAADPVLPLLTTIHTYSSWHHVPSQQAPQQTSHLNADLEVPRLEFTIDELEKNLKDPSCTRDIDDMMTELNQAKGDLRRLKWKRRLGW
jgi:hypothetical protein